MRMVARVHTACVHKLWDGEGQNSKNKNENKKREEVKQKWETTVLM